MKAICAAERLMCLWNLNKIRSALNCYNMPCLVGSNVRDSALKAVPSVRMLDNFKRSCPALETRGARGNSEVGALLKQKRFLSRSRQSWHEKMLLC